MWVESFIKNFLNKLINYLKEDGISLVHTIGSVNPPRDPHPWITKYIFPGGYTPSLSEVTTPVEKAGLIVSDIEVLRLHYSHTLRHWKENCINNKEKIIQMFDEKFFRMWEFYLAGCEMAFKWGDQVVYQFQLTKIIHPLQSQETIFINKLLIEIKLLKMKKTKKKSKKIKSTVKRKTNKKLKPIKKKSKKN